MVLSKAQYEAKKIQQEFGLLDLASLQNLELKTLIQARGAYYEETDLENCDGRIVTFSGRSIISISDKITDKGKKRFTAAHELGHHELHKTIAVKADTHYEMCNWFQKGSHEKEANDFASELLMPSVIFKEECRGKKFSPDLVKYLASQFVVSQTAVLLKYLNLDIHPICVVCSKNNKVKWWKMSEKMETAEHEFVSFPILVQIKSIIFYHSY